MKNTGNDITVAINTDASFSSHNKSCRHILDDYALPYTYSEFYLQVGDIKPEHGWVLHLTVIKQQLMPLLELIIPELIQTGFPFQVVQDKQTLRLLLDGNLGYNNLGKVICIYPGNDSQALIMAKKLISLTGAFRGPAIPTDIYLGSIVYTNYDEAGKQGIPFVMPKGISWPFGDITSPLVPPMKKLWNNAYKPNSVIKPDAKGRVIKGLYLKGFLNIKLCVIKEGKSNMWVDSEGRDIQDRLLWQYELYQTLGKDIPTPKIFDVFKENRDLFLVMEFIKGESLEKKIASIYRGNSWDVLFNKKKLKLIDLLIKLVDIIDKLHKKGYLHRDITPGNFLVNKKDEVFLIDMELAYSIFDKKPSPAFKHGTPGYMSPEQDKYLTPDIPQDIYALGALMLLFFTGLPSVKFKADSITGLQQKISFFIKYFPLARLITGCLHHDPSKRPCTLEIKETIVKYREELIENSQIKKEFISPGKPTQTALKKRINEAIAGLINPEIMTSDYIWTSLSSKKDKFIGNEQLQRNISPGFYTGVAGILWLIAKAESLGYDINPCGIAYDRSWDFLLTQYKSSNTISTGLFEGTAGIALALQEGITSGLIIPSEHVIEYLKQCFEQPSQGLGIASGIAGQGLSLLKASHLLSADFSLSLLKKYRDTLINSQQKDGSWKVFKKSAKKQGKIPGLFHGIAGITWFLLLHAKQNLDTDSETAAKKALNWLMKQVRKSQGYYHWLGITKSKPIDVFSVSKSGFDIALTFIKAFEMFKDPLYKKVAEYSLQLLPPYPVCTDYTSASGLAGLGEVYLEASRAFKTPHWQERADWIANVLYHTFREEEKNIGGWAATNNPTPEADLMTGNSGIIHFLMQYQQPNISEYIF